MDMISHHWDSRQEQIKDASVDGLEVKTSEVLDGANAAFEG